MKMNDNHHHICVECSCIMDDSCEFYETGIVQEGMKVKRRKRQFDDTTKVMICNDFIDDTECLSCVHKATCLVVETIGEECKRFYRVGRTIE